MLYLEVPLCGVWVLSAGEKQEVFSLQQNVLFRVSKAL